jgi:RNA polymerase sigma-70 factor (ECF subfamily)
MEVRYHVAILRCTDSRGSGNIHVVLTLPRPPDASPPPAPAEEPRRPLDFAAVYEQHFAFVWRVARRLGVPEAALDDVCQDVFVIVHRRLGEFEGRSSLKTWVYGILHNVVLTWRRTSRRKDPARAEIDPDLLLDTANGPHEAASGAQAARIAHAMLATLGDEKRTIFVLVELEGMSVPEAAEATGANLNTAYARLRAARAEFAAAVARFQARERGRT